MFEILPRCGSFRDAARQRTERVSNFARNAMANLAFLLLAFVVAFVQSKGSPRGLHRAPKCRKPAQAKTTTCETPSSHAFARSPTPLPTAMPRPFQFVLPSFLKEVAPAANISFFPRVLETPPSLKTEDAYMVRHRASLRASFWAEHGVWYFCDTSHLCAHSTCLLHLRFIRTETSIKAQSMTLARKRAVEGTGLPIASTTSANFQKD